MITILTLLVLHFDVRSHKAPFLALFCFHVSHAVLTWYRFSTHPQTMDNKVAALSPMGVNTSYRNQSNGTLELLSSSCAKGS